MAELYWRRFCSDASDKVIISLFPLYKGSVCGNSDKSQFSQIRCHKVLLVRFQSFQFLPVRYHRVLLWLEMFHNWKSRNGYSIQCIAIEPFDSGVVEMKCYWDSRIQNLSLSFLSNIPKICLIIYLTYGL